MSKDSFIVYDGIKDTLDEMTDEEVGKLFRAMVDYHTTGEDPKLKGGLKFAFIPVRQQMDRDDEKWNKTREARIEAGRKGGEAKKQNEANEANANFANQNEANEASVCSLVNEIICLPSFVSMLTTPRSTPRMESRLSGIPPHPRCPQDRHPRPRGLRIRTRQRRTR